MMSESIPRTPADQQALKPCRRRFTDEFKQDAVRLITDQHSPSSNCRRTTSGFASSSSGLRPSVRF